MASLGVGSVLRNERLRRNLDLDEISRRTRIAPRFIEAIEEEDFSRLPAVVFTRGFVRQYSTALDLDPEPLLAALPRPDIAGAPLPNPLPKSRRSLLDPGLRSTLQTAFFVLAAIGAGSLAWFWFDSPAEPGTRFSFVGWRVLQTKTEAKSVPPSTGIAQSTTAPEEPEAVASADPMPFADPKPGPPVMKEKPAAPPVEVTVAAHEVTWVRITADGKRAFSGMLQASEERTVGASDRVNVLAGNAGGLDISLNGRKLDPLGSSGQVRSITLTSDGPQADGQIPPPSSGQSWTGDGLSGQRVFPR